MRVVGKPVEPTPERHWPTPQEVRFTRAVSGTALLYDRRGVVRFETMPRLMPTCES
jgi:hypothetical protein